MISELDALSAKIEAALAVIEELRIENSSLQEQLQTVETERNFLRQRLEAARARLELLVQQLPEDQASWAITLFLTSNWWGGNTVLPVS